MACALHRHGQLHNPFSWRIHSTRLTSKARSICPPPKLSNRSTNPPTRPYETSTASKGLHPTYPISLPASSPGKITEITIFSKVFRARTKDGLSSIWIMSVCTSLYPLSTEPAQVLNTLDSVGPAYQECLRVLRWICYIEERLPRSYMLDVSLLPPIADPSSTGPYETLYEGSLNGAKVCAKKLRASFPSGSVLCQRRCFFCLPC